MLRLRPIAQMAIVVALISSLCLAVGPASAQETWRSIAGVWNGTIDVPASPLEVIVTFESGDEGTWSGTIDIPIQKIAGFALRNITIDGDSIVFGISGIPGDPTFDGRLSEDGDTLAGTFRQAGGEIAFEFRRGEAEAVGPDPREALADFAALVEGALEDLNVPGVGVAIYARGEVVLSSGFGQRNVEGDRPVTDETLFAIGSTTKAMTATVVAGLVDEGKLAWDEPVRRYLPEFQLYDESASARLTVRDLLIHSSGLPRHDFVWYGSEASRDELLASLRHLEPTLDLRQGWQYQNLMFLVAGMVSERVSGKSWETLVRERILQPLDMNETDFSVARLAEHPQAATGYRPNDSGDGVEAVPYRNIDAMGPAGSVNSSVAELIHWAAFQLGDGKAGDTEIVSAATLAELHTPKMVMPTILGTLVPADLLPYQLYAHAWMIAPYRGRHVVLHGGGIDGFRASVAFLPFDDIAIVVLANRQGTQLPNVLTLAAIDRLVGLEPMDWVGKAKLLEQQARQLAETAEPEEPVEGTSPAHDLETYEGFFAHPGYGELAVEQAGDGLKLTYNGIEIDLDHWHFETFAVDGGMFDGSKFTFETLIDGTVGAVGTPFEPNLPPIRFERIPDPGLADPVRLEAFVGTFGNEAIEITFSVLPEGKLRAVVVGQPNTTLVPVSETEFRVEELEGYKAKFLVEGEVVTSVELIQPNGKLNLPKL